MDGTKVAEIVEDSNGEKIVRINNIRFKGKRKVDWNDVESYLEGFIGKQVTIEESGDIIHIGNEFPDEFAGSKYTYKLMGTAAKAKANAAQGILEMLQIANGKHFRENVSLRYIRHKKRNEQPFGVLRLYSAQNPFLFLHSKRKSWFCQVPYFQKLRLLRWALFLYVKARWSHGLKYRGGQKESAPHRKSKHQAVGNDCE